MKKSKIKLLSIAACLALVGTASAAWAYAGTATQSASIGVKVAAYADAGSITISDTSNIRVVLDKNSIYFTETSITANYVAPTSVSGVTVNEGTNYTIDRSWYVVISFNLTTYATYSDSASTSGVDDDYDEDGTANKKKMGSWSDGVAVTLPSLTWQSGMMPENETQYKSLVNKIAPGSITDDNWSTTQSNEWDFATSVPSYNVKVVFEATITAKE